MDVDFIIIGSMKAATTTLYTWLGDQPEIHMAAVKEPSFFSYPDNWSRGYGWYEGLFEGAQPGQLLGEASTSYTFPEYREDAARRIAEHHPDVKLVFIVRHPVDRIRSHYRHEVQRAREQRSLTDALDDPNNPYVKRSEYFKNLKPYIDRFEREQIQVIKTEDLIDATGDAWCETLRHLGLNDRPSPGTPHNQSETKPQFTAGMLRLWESGWYDRLKRIPKPVRRLARPLLTKSGSSYEARLEQSNAPIDPATVIAAWDDVARLEDWLGSTLWKRESTTAPPPRTAG